MSQKSVNRVIIGQRYAKAFFTSGVSQQEIDEFLDVGKSIVNDNLFLKMLNVSKVKHNKLHSSDVEWFKEVCKKLNLSQKVSNFLMLIALKKRLPCLEAIVSAIQDVAYKKSGQDFATLILATPATDAEIASITKEIKKITSIEPILNIIVNSDIIGGYVVRTRSLVIDNSLKKRIEKLHNIMKGVA